MHHAEHLNAVRKQKVNDPIALENQFADVFTRGFGDHSPNARVIHENGGGFNQPFREAQGIHRFVPRNVLPDAFQRLCCRLGPFESHGVVAKRRLISSWLNTRPSDAAVSPSSIIF